MKGRYLNTNFSIKNHGLKDSGKFKLGIYADNKLVKELEFENLEVGYGRTTILKNLVVNKFSSEELKYVVKSDSLELGKSNNEVTLRVG